MTTTSERNARMIFKVVGLCVCAGRLRPISMPVECTWAGDYEDPKLNRESRRGVCVCVCLFVCGRVRVCVSVS